MRAGTLREGPDFIIADEITPEVIIEAKITNDGTGAGQGSVHTLRLAELSLDDPITTITVCARTSRRPSE